MTTEQAPALDELIASWRDWMERRDALSLADVDELESHLRDRVDALTAAGLTEDEAFLIAVRRLGNLDELSREYAAEHSGRLWKQLVLHDSSDIGARMPRPARSRSRAVPTGSPSPSCSA